MTLCFSDFDVLEGEPVHIHNYSILGRLFRPVNHCSEASRGFLPAKAFGTAAARVIGADLTVSGQAAGYAKSAAIIIAAKEGTAPDDIIVPRCFRPGDRVPDQPRAFATGIVTGRILVLTPFPDIPGHIEQPKRIGRIAAHWGGPTMAIQSQILPGKGALPEIGLIVGLAAGCIPPGILLVLLAGAGSPFPFGLGGQSLAPPAAIGFCIGMTQGGRPGGVDDHGYDYLALPGFSSSRRVSTPTIAGESGGQPGHRWAERLMRQAAAGNQVVGGYREATAAEGSPNSGRAQHSFGNRWPAQKLQKQHWSLRIGPVGRQRRRPGGGGIHRAGHRPNGPPFGIARQGSRPCLPVLLRKMAPIVLLLPCRIGSVGQRGGQLNKAP